MRVVSWNCSFGKFSEKFEQIVKRTDADVYIIQECPNPNTDETSNLLKQYEIQKPLWDGHKNKNGTTSGIGIFVKNNRSLSELEHDTDNGNLKHYVFCKIDDFNILGIWANSRDEKDYYSPYLRKYLERNLQKIDDNCIIAGDLNLDVNPEAGRIADVNAIYKMLADKKLVSAYHKQTGEPFGKEKVKTFYRGLEPSVHIDYLFASSNKINRIELGTINEWVRYSDHIPLFVLLESVCEENEFAGSNAANTGSLFKTNDTDEKSVESKTKTQSSKSIKIRDSDSDLVKRGLELIEQNGIVEYKLIGYPKWYKAKTPATIRKDDKDWGIEKLKD